MSNSIHDGSFSVSRYPEERSDVGIQSNINSTPTSKTHLSYVSEDSEAENGSNVTLGTLVTFEGGEGVGKSTQASLLAQKLTDMGLKAVKTREPGGDVIGEKIRDVLKTSKPSDMEPLCELLLMFAARRDHFVKLIKPMMDDGYFVICDRFYDSSLVYQGVLKNVPFEDIMLLKKITIGDFEPNLTIVLDVDPDISIGRLSTRNLIPDEYDLMKKDKHDLVRKGFQKTAEIFSFRSVIVNAAGSEQKVFSRIMKVVQERLLLA
ncbi:thymidylate kinase [Alphaproteobacteria bacterium]|nr:thymidylate kinase [Alphaproteobacteria bacterium]